MLGKTLEEVDDMQASEIVLWRDYLSEPRGEDRLDFNTAQVVQAIYTFMLGFSGDKKKVSLEDCLLKFSSEEEDSEQNVLRNILAMQAMFGKIGAEPITKLTEKIKNDSKTNSIKM